MLSKEDLYRVGALARIEIKQEDEAVLQERMERVLVYVNRLSLVPTQGVPENENIGDLAMLRSDEAMVVEDLTRQTILNDFPDRVGDALRVPAVFENPKG